MTPLRLFDNLTLVLSREGAEEGFTSCSLSTTPGESHFIILRPESDEPVFQLFPDAACRAGSALRRCAGYRTGSRRLVRNIETPGRAPRGTPAVSLSRRPVEPAAVCHAART